MTPAETWFAITTDHAFRTGAMRLAALQSAHAPAYAYLFTWPSSALNGLLGSCHALEIPFVFGALDIPGMEQFAGSGPAANLLTEQMQAAWLAFTRAGTPASENLPAWPRYTPERRATPILGEQITVEGAPREPERVAWGA